MINEKQREKQRKIEEKRQINGSANQRGEEQGEGGGAAERAINNNGRRQLINMQERKSHKMGENK